MLRTQNDVQCTRDVRNRLSIIDYTLMKIVFTCANVTRVHILSGTRASCLLNVACLELFDELIIEPQQIANNTGTKVSNDRVELLPGKRNK